MESDGASLTFTDGNASILGDAFWKRVPQLNPKKLSWLHIPKAGTSFANVLVTWGCPSLPAKAVVDETYSDEYGMFVPNFMHMHTKECAPGMTLCGSGHMPLKDHTCLDYSQHEGQFVAMFRQPEQRIVSGFFHNLHDVDEKSLDLPSYSRKISGCSVRMINGYSCGNKEGIKMTEQLVETALDRLEDGFAFVGLTEEWALSVCLFHKMFGGTPHKREFQNVRPGAEHREMYDTSDLKGFVDAADGAVYSRAYVMFWANVQRYGATTSACKKLCGDATTYFD